MKFHFDVPCWRSFNLLAWTLVSLFNLATCVLQSWEIFWYYFLITSFWPPTSFIFFILNLYNDSLDWSTSFLIFPVFFVSLFLVEFFNIVFLTSIEFLFLPSYFWYLILWIFFPQHLVFVPWIVFFLFSLRVSVTFLIFVAVFWFPLLSLFFLLPFSVCFSG